MVELFATGQIVDAILGLVLAEAVLLICYARLTGRGIAPANLVANLLSGTALLLALRCALVSAPWAATAACLAAALLAHLADLALRWRR